VVTTVKERPILMSAPMALASLDDSKLMTRRVVKWNNPAPGLNLGFSGLAAYSYVPGVFSLESQRGDGAWESRSDATVCPYGRPGDRLWVRETLFAWGRWETRFSAKKGRDEWRFVDMTLECGKDYLYAADGVSDTRAFIKRRGGIEPMYWKRPAIFMPRAASRTSLGIVSVRVERLQAINHADALAEGILTVRTPEWDLKHFGAWRKEFDEACRLGIKPPVGPSPCATYRALWEQLNGSESWAANPWVWVIEFRRIKP
jgi:hypothetical protein